jgi:hypothetical protein
MIARIAVKIMITNLDKGTSKSILEIVRRSVTGFHGAANARFVPVAATSCRLNRRSLALHFAARRLCAQPYPATDRYAFTRRAERIARGLLRRHAPRATMKEETIVRTTLNNSTLIAAAMLASLMAGTASAMPVAAVQADQSAKVEQTRWVCGWRGHCFWRPTFRSNLYAYNYYIGPPPRFYHRAWGWHRPWGWRHRFWHRGWW